MSTVADEPRPTFGEELAVLPEDVERVNYAKCQRVRMTDPLKMCGWTLKGVRFRLVVVCLIPVYKYLTSQVVTTYLYNPIDQLSLFFPERTFFLSMVYINVLLVAMQYL